MNNTITNNPREIAITLNDYFLTVADNVIANIKRDNSDPRHNVNPSYYLFINFNSPFPELNGTML